MAGAALSQGQVQISWQAHKSCKVKREFRSKRGTFARSSIDIVASVFVAGSAVLQGQVRISWQRGTFAQSSTDVGGKRRTFRR